MAGYTKAETGSNRAALAVLIIVIVIGSITLTAFLVMMFQICCQMRATAAHNARVKFSYGKKTIGRRTRTKRKLLNLYPVVHYRAGDNYAQTTCLACYEDFQENDIIRILPCGDIFHTICIESWLQASSKAKCPICYN
ncbi:hypothetical protein M5689_008055 [Euphorbia peplus]|nr:hypothetical protein M5689_008055 [Euphorbia peplus]